MAETGKALIKLPAGYKKGDVIQAQTICIHPQDTGYGKDKEGKPIPAFHVTSVEVWYGEKRISDMEVHGAISKDPYISFKVRASHSAPLKVVWKDTKGNVFEQSAEIKV